ncbi:MAG TPA: hypothetical protein VKE88_03980, partial [Candidatus Nanoarchaeia archaeon]|nr:hypothetical protein [Candidatus Nanoarchaeia archaeon]
MKQRTTILLIATIIIILGMSYFYTQNDIVVPAQLPVKDDSAFVFIHSEATKEQAFNALLQAEKDIVELQQRGFSTFFVRDRLRKAQQFYIGHLPQQLLSDISRAEGVNKEYLQKLYEVSETTPVFEVELQDFSKVVEITQFIAFKKQQIYDLADSISLIESDILALKAQDAPVTQAESTLNAAKEEFSSERYSDALFLLKETLTEMKEAQSERNRALYIIDLGKSFIERHWLAI